MNQDKQSFCATISRRAKDETEPIIVYLIKVDMSFSENTDAFVLVSAKLKCQILFQGISDATKIGIYHAVTVENLEKKCSLIRLHFYFYNED